MNPISQFFYPCFCADTSHQKLEDNDAAVFVATEEDNPYNEAAPVAACRTGNIDWLKALIAESDSIICRDYRSGKTGDMFPLVAIAVHKGYLEVTDLLIRHGADVNRATDTGTAPLSFAAIQGHTEMAELLIRHGADVNRTDKKTGATPLCFAASEGHTEVVELLIQYGAQVNKADKKRTTPLYLAAQNCYPAIVRCLLDAGADPGKKWRILGSLITKSPLSAARLHSKDGEIVTMLKTAIKERSSRSADSAKLLIGRQHSSYGTI